ncbi:RICIN domain-containing protein [Streptomyces sp. ID05-04B]|uniref:RICIN domain-containing protein n=1 Tax=unclassified Streptomyces TaxID=2593676 RepID=UPI000D1B8ED7|nr:MULTISPECIES: RICIN domain-containing protein [unclassified Streptomyces]AVV43859.1 hydrolase [Streptomyces sp. P3]MDX5562563.1 RICIN domain-containing protein [Streptomyces sp. ID05-04B]
MQSPNPPRPPHPPRPGWTPGDSDPQLVARLAGGDGRHRAIALLFARHWRAAHDYATVCLAGTEDTARLVAAAAFHEVLGRLADGRTAGALRPELLVAVRETVRQWAGAESVSAVLPELRKTVGGRGLRAARPATAERRQLAEHAFQLLPAASQCLLWHTEVESEPITVPAGLSGMDAVTAAAVLEQAREQFRAACVRAHRELAPTGECRFYNRLLDIPLRRGGTLLPDVRQHLAHCRFCRHAAEQLSHFDGGLDVLLAETVLGWGALRYLESRPARTAAADAAPRPVPVRPLAGTGRHRTTSAGLLALPGRRPRALLVGAGLTALALVATVFVARGWTEDTGVPGPGATWGAPAGGISAPGTTAQGGPGSRSSSAFPSAASASRSMEIARGRLRGPDTELCLDVRGGRPAAGAAIVLTSCSQGATQQWSYEEDGLLRSSADPTLCLAADPHRRTTALAGCLVHSGETFFDLTVRGELVLRRNDDLVVARDADGSGRGLAVAPRDGSAGQRWLFDAVAPSEGRPGPSVRGSAEPPDPKAVVPPGAPAPRDAAPVAPDAAPEPAEPTPSAPQFHTRIVQADCCDSAGDTGSPGSQGADAADGSGGPRFPGEPGTAGTAGTPGASRVPDGRSAPAAHLRALPVKLGGQRVPIRAVVGVTRVLGR